MSVIAVVFLVSAAALLVVAEWPRLGKALHVDGKKARHRKKVKAGLRVIRTESDAAEEFARSVERDLASLPTTDDRDVKRRP